MLIKSSDSIQSGLLLLKAEILAKLNNSPEGVIIEVSEFKPKRTNIQNKFYWANVHEITELLRAKNVKKVIDNKEFNIKIELLITDEEVHEINKNVGNITTTTKMSKKEFIDFMDKIFAFWITTTNGEWSPKELTKGYLERTGML